MPSARSNLVGFVEDGVDKVVVAGGAHDLDALFPGDRCEFAEQGSCVEVLDLFGLGSDDHDKTWVG